MKHRGLCVTSRAQRLAWRNAEYRSRLGRDFYRSDMAANAIESGEAAARAKRMGAMKARLLADLRAKGKIADY